MKNAIKIQISLAVGTVLTAGAASAAVPSADAAPQKDPARPITVKARFTKDAHRVSPAPGNDVSDYWTPERLRRAAANPADAPSTPNGHEQHGQHAQTTRIAARETQRSVPPKAPPSATAGQPNGQATPANGEQEGKPAPASRTVGKVFFRNAKNKMDYSCSAAVVNSPSGNLLSTAGHCVHDSRKGDWHLNWTFAPDFAYGKQPFGLWKAEWLTSFAGWVEQERADYDVAFVKVAARGKSDLVRTVGGNGLETGMARKRHLTVLGYPVLPPYPGDHQYFCTGDAAPEGSRLKMPCTLTTGVSGGPWLSRYETASGVGSVNGVAANTNLKNTTLWSPYFGEAVWNLYRRADPPRP